MSASNSPRAEVYDLQDEQYSDEISSHQLGNSFSSSLDSTPSVVKSEARNLMKRLDSNADDVAAAEELQSLCMIASNRKNLAEGGILSSLTLALKTKSPGVKEVLAHVLQLFAQDGGEVCVAMKRLNLCNTTLEMIGKTDNLQIQIPLVGVIYWMAQNPQCKKEFLDLGAITYLKDMNARVKDPLLSKYLNHAINGLSPQVKSREELLEEIVSTPISFKDLEIIKTQNPKKKSPYETLVFGKEFTDHMLEVDWESASGWGKPRIVPYHNLDMPPSCSALHYAIQCFEGMKAYRDQSGTSCLFRPEMNIDRFNKSCRRISLPAMDGGEFLKCLAALVKLESEWIPNRKGFSLYIRPTCISTDATLGVSPPQKAKLFVIMSPVGPYFKSGFSPVKLLAEPKYIRAFPGSTGDSKIGANYGPTILPQQEAAKKGYSQILWLLNNYGKTGVVSEVGTMNMFFYWYNEKGEKELVTAPLDGTVLPGVTRDTILRITRGEWGMNVSESIFTMEDVIKAIEEKRMIEAFGAGTACIVSPVSTISYREKEYSIPVGDEKTGLAPKLFNHILAIQQGDIESPFRVAVDDLLKL